MTIGERARQEQLERAERDPRRQFGWGVSSMASPEERRAWEALDTQEAIERGEATVADLPEQYGGRPQGTTRRAIRMQAEWDAQQAARLAEEQDRRAQVELQRQQERAGRQETREQYRYNKEVEADLAKSTKDSEIEKQGMAFVSGLRQLDPRSSDYFIERTKLYDENPLALADPNIKKLTSEFDEINKIYQERDQKKAQEAEAAEGLKNQQLVQLTKLAKLTGRNLSDIVQSNPQTGELIVDPVALGEAEADLATKPVADPNAPTYRRESAKLREQLRQLDAKILANETDAKRATTDWAREEYENNLNILTGQRNLLYSEYMGVQELLEDSGTATPTPATNVTDAQIESAKRIAQDPNHPRNASAVEFLKENNIEIDNTSPAAPSTQIDMAPVQVPPPAAGAAPQPTPEQILQTSTDPLELAEASVQATQQKSKEAKEAERQKYIDKIEEALAESPIPSPDIFNTPKAKEIAASPNARELAQQRYSDLQSAAFKGRAALSKKKDGISDDVFDKVLDEMLELRILLGDSPKDAQDLIDRIRSNK